MGRFIEIGGSVEEPKKRRGRPPKSVELDRRVASAMRGNVNGTVKMKEIVGKEMRTQPDVSMWRSNNLPMMLSLYLDPKNGMNYELIAREVNAKAREQGLPYVVTKQMVQSDIRDALKKQIRQKEGETDAVWSAAASALKMVISNCVEDYEKSKGVDAKSEASMLRTLVKDAGMTYEEAMTEIERKRYAGNSDHLRVMMEAVERYAGMYGLSVKAASVALQNQQNGQQNQTGNIVNYNFADVDRDKVKDIVRMIQDGKLSQMKEEDSSSASPVPGTEEEVADEQ